MDWMYYLAEGLGILGLVAFLAYGIIKRSTAKKTLKAPALIAPPQPGLAGPKPGVPAARCRFCGQTFDKKDAADDVPDELLRHVLAMHPEKLPPQELEKLRGLVCQIAQRDRLQSNQKLMEQLAEL